MAEQDRARDSLDFLYQRQLFGIKLGLDNIRQLLFHSGDPQQGLRIIHIAGTNGKGSVAAALASIFAAAGIPAGLYTSPHLHHFGERIRIANRPLEEAELVELIDMLRPQAEQLRATFFELATALALHAFARHRITWAILETGMGGRLDATNVVNPELCLLTRISRDHSRHLGETLEQIAMEKAGILKSGVPAISVTQAVEARGSIRQRAASVGAPLNELGTDIPWQADSGGCSFAAYGLTVSSVRLGLLGDHQAENMVLAGAAAARLASTGVPLTEAAIRQGLERVRWPGRLEWLPGRILLDGAHNPEAAQALAVYLGQARLDQVHLVVGCKADKDSSAVLAALLPRAKVVYTVRPPVETAASPAELAELARAAGRQAYCCEDPRQALQLAQQQRADHETIVVTGSLFLVAAVRGLLLGEESPPLIADQEE